MLTDMFRTVWIILLGLGLFQILSAREFKSADGKSRMEAEFIRYSPETGKVTLRLNTTRNIVTPATAFSEEDQAYFKEAQKRIDMQESLEVKIRRDFDPEKEDLGDGDVVTNRSVRYVFTVKNKSRSVMTGMRLEYWVLVQKEVDREGVNITSNKVDLEPILPGGERSVVAPAFPMYKFERHVTNDREKGRIVTIDKKRYEIYGAKADLYAADGEKVLSERTSIRVDNLLESKP